MSGTTRALLVAVTWGLVLAGGARASDALLGGENWRFETDLDLKSGTGDFVAHHASSALTSEFRLNKNFSLNLNIGEVTSSLEDETTGTSAGPGDGLYVLAGLSIEQELDTGGGLMIDASYSIGRAEWNAGAMKNEFNHGRSRLFIGYLFGRGDRSRVYTGVSYNTYEAELIDSGFKTDYENDQRWSLLAGVRARSETFVGTAEVCAVGELGFRLGLAFGF